MKKTALLITLLLVFVVAGYLIYDKYYHQAPTTLWRLVPENAIAVFELPALAETHDRLQENPIWNTLTQIEQVNGLNTWLLELDSLGGQASLAGLTEGDFLISMHAIKKNSFDFLYLLNLNAPGSQRTLSKLLTQLQDEQGWRIDKRTYQDTEILELRHEGKTFSYLLHDNKFIGSYTPFLVEDVVRLITNDQQPDFSMRNPGLEQMPKLSKDDGNIYIDVRRLSDFFGGFADGRSSAGLEPLDILGHSAFLDLTIDDNSILLNGFTEDGTNTFLSTFAGQQPVHSDIKYLIPTSAAYLYQFALSDPASWHDALLEFWKITEPEYLSNRQEFFKIYQLDPAEFYETLGESITLMAIENPGDPEYTPLLLLETGDMAGMMNQLNRLSESAAKASADSLYIETFGNYEIRELDVLGFPEQLFGPFFSGFDVTFYALVGEVVVFSPDIITLKDLLEDMESEDTWGRSVLYNQFLENTLEEANISFFVNSRRSWEHTLRVADSNWRSFAIRHGSILKSFGLMSCQFSRLDDNFYTSLLIQHDGSVIDTRESVPLELASQSSFENELVTKPFVVRNHITNGLETLVQDSAHTLYLVNGDGQISWGKPLPGRIIGEIEQLDYYSNGKLQYFFATSNELHLIDRLGNEVEGYPIALSHPVKYVTAIDYDKSRRYRYLVADPQGNLFMYNKEGENLEGWQPRPMASRLSSAPFHIRVRGKDFILAVEASGKIHAFNRRGDIYSGFPLDLESRVETTPFVKPGATFEQTQITVIDKDGKRVVFDLNGRIRSSEQLYKPTTDTEFDIIPDALGKTYIIARLEGRRMVLLNQVQQEIMAKDYLSAQQLEIQYYDFGSDVRMFVVVDRQQGYTYIYDQNGRLIGTRPLDSGKQIALLYSEMNKEFTIYYVSKANVLVKKL